MHINITIVHYFAYYPGYERNVIHLLSCIQVMDVESSEQITVDDGASGGIDNKDNDFDEVGLR